MRILIILLAFQTFSSFSQDQLRNTYSTWGEVIGGVEGSGVQRSEAYYFIAADKISLKGLWLGEKEITLVKGDTLMVQVHTHLDHPGQVIEQKTSGNAKVKEKDRFKVVKRNRIYYALVMYPYVWEKKIEYTRKKKTYTAVAKKEFDKGSQEAAP